MPAPFSTPHSVPVPLPALYLYPLNDSFVPKHISLVNNQRVKIGRQTNVKTVPGERNGFFDSKVLSRQHAEVWEESGKIFIKDVKSSNGTFINGERLSPEGLESEPFELKTDDIVEFGIDIVGEDNKTIIHHKVAARVVCVFNEAEAQAAARVEAQQNPSSYGSVAGQATAGNAFSFSGQQPGPNGVPGQPRRPTMQPQGLVGMGGMGGNVRQPGKSGLTFDHILSRLQGELQKSRDTGAELHSLTGAMNEIHDALGGNLPSNLPPYPSSLPPVMPSQSQPQHEQNHQQPSATDSTSALSELQSQLRETQMSLANHVDKIRALEGMLAEHDAIKREVSSMRDMMEERKREMETFRRHSGSPVHLHHQHNEEHRLHDEHDGQYLSDDDDARSISTVVPHELERVDEEDEEQLAAEEEEERRQRRDEMRPRTPEPTGMGMTEDDDEHEQDHEDRRLEQSPHSRMRSRSPSPPSAAPPVHSAMLPDELADRLTTLSKQLEAALELSRSLEAQHTTAQSTISMLESKVAALETLVHTTQTQVQAQVETTQQLVQAADTARSMEVETRPQVSLLSREEEHAKERESLTEMVSEWKKSVEGRWSGVQEEWFEERERLRRAREEWEVRVRAVEEGLGNAVSKVETGLSVLQTLQFQAQANGNARMNSSGGLVTPPSPRSLSAESTRPRQRKKRISSPRGRTRSRSASAISADGHDSSPASSISVDLTGHKPSFSNSRVRRRSPWATDDSSASDSEPHLGHSTAIDDVKDAESRKLMRGLPFPITPESSVVNQPLTSHPVSGAATDARTEKQPKDLVSFVRSFLLHCILMLLATTRKPQFNNLSTAVGFVVLSVAAAAVIWRVKPEASM
ncbi:hypothetical protein AcV7_003649 [Taiwanofungus camphoratus]|nr:hypothetical protein AcV7_003649 [Antrodia cinnamomea]